MKSKNLFFSVDRLGDYLIRSNVIKKVSEYYDYNEIICSNINFKLIKNQNFFNKISIFDNNSKFTQGERLIYLRVTHSNSIFKNKILKFDGAKSNNLVGLNRKLKKTDWKFIKQNIFN